MNVAWIRGCRRRVGMRWRVVALLGLLTTLSPVLDAADTWVEIKGRNVTVFANGSTGDARRLAWQLEQVRAAIVHVLPWARVDLDRPFVVFAVNNEARMRALVPGSFERSRDTHPVSVWVSGADQHYLAIRSDIEPEDRLDINPHMHAYFSYISLVMADSLERELPPWFARGLAGLLSNTIVRDAELRVGAPIPWHLQALRSGSRWLLPELVSMTDDAVRKDLARFDAHAWAFVHFLMFGDNGARAPLVNKFFGQLNAGVPADKAMTDAFGPINQLDGAFVRYVNQSIMSFVRLPVDASVKREGFEERVLPAHEAASALALFHVAMRRPVEARAAIAESRKGGAPAPDSYLAEALLANSENKRDEAQAALGRAVAESSKNAHAYFALARIQWDPDADKAALAEREKLLLRTIVLNPRHAWALSLLGETRSQLGASDGLQYVARAIKLAPSQSEHRLAAAIILRRAGMHADALRAVEVALSLATTEAQRQRAREMQQVLEREKPKDL